MRGKVGLLLMLTAVLIVGGCGGSSQQSSALTFDMRLLQIEGELLVEGIVFNDVSDFGVMNSTEGGIEGVTVNLTDPDENPLESTDTDADGYYAFAVTVAGFYSVNITVPAGYEPTTPSQVDITVTDADVMVDFGLRGYEVPVDVKPGSNINPLNLRSKGVLPVAILGSETFDVTMVDPSSLRLNDVAPLRWSYEDVCGSGDDDDNGNGYMTSMDDEEIPDGYMDLTLKFLTEDIAAAILNSHGEVSRGDVITLTMTGMLTDAVSAISGEETVWIVQVPKSWL